VLFPQKRYIAVQIVPHTPTNTLRLNDYTLSKCLLQNVEKYYGVYGLGLIENGFRVKYCNDRTKIAIIRCLHRGQQFVSSVLPLITLVTKINLPFPTWILKTNTLQIGDVRAKFRTLYIGATIIQCNKFIIKHQKQFLDKAMGQLNSAKERQDLFKRVMEFDMDR
ncbi:hypothetical protein KR026_012564, partial [Drosophila bipectinata]